MPRDARHAVRRVRRLRQRRLDFLRQRRRDAFVGVERQDPVVRRQRRREVLLRDVPGPRSRTITRSVNCRAMRDGVVGALGVDDDDLVGPADRRQRRRDVRRFVLVMTVTESFGTEGKEFASYCRSATPSGSA